MATEGEQFLARLRVPDFRRFVSTGGSDASPIRAVRNRKNPPGVICQGEPFAAARGETSQILAVLSALAVATRVPSGLNTACSTALPWPARCQQQLTGRRVPNFRYSIITACSQARSPRVE